MIERIHEKKKKICFKRKLRKIIYTYIYIYIRAPGRFVYRLEHPGSQGYWSEEGAIERTKVRLDPLEPLV